ncbi:hypothetical protein Cantr_05686 [Candida viswanathii]|uniref:Uncharacterized protein n=1 Tax=Candida viswanathii TaxID=5486 RepID=A0A367XS18_9ASCO|nr:hypothetical protein Cantr_05686 [Candida viswanathii]
MRVVTTIVSIFALISASVAETVTVTEGPAPTAVPIAAPIASSVTVPVGVGSPLAGAVVSDNSNGGLNVNVGNIKVTCNEHCKMAADAIATNCQNKGLNCICALPDDTFWNHIPECDCINPFKVMNGANFKNLACNVGRGVLANVASNAGATFGTTFATTFTTVATA